MYTDTSSEYSPSCLQVLAQGHSKPGGDISKLLIAFSFSINLSHCFLDTCKSFSIYNFMSQSVTKSYYVSPLPSDGLSSLIIVVLREAVKNTIPHYSFCFT